MTPAGPRFNMLARLRCLFPWWFIALLAMLFAGLALAARGSGSLAVDRSFGHWLQGWDQPIAGQLATLGNRLGESMVGLAVLVVGWVVFPLLGMRRELWFVAIAGVLRLAATQTKDLFDSPRPAVSQGFEVRQNFDGLGFPSGHAMTSAVLFGTIVFLVWRIVPDRSIRWGSVAVAVFGMLVTDFARVWVGAHWLTDVAGGTVGGLLIVSIAATVSGLISPDRANAIAPPPNQTLT